MAVCTRFAPSPTGRLHLGHALAAVVAHELGAGGALLRMEDLDASRVRPRYVEGILEDMRWLGLEWAGELCFQSERMATYERALSLLREMEVLYPCFCTRREIAAELQAMGGAPHGPDGPVYPGTCRRLDRGDAWRRAGEQPHALRLDVAAACARVGEREFDWQELGRGRVRADARLFGDVVLGRKDAGVAYHLAVVVDDADQGVELVTRGEDLFEATALHRLLQVLLGLPELRWFHHALVCDENGERLAKRHDSLSLRALREAGVSADEVWARVRGELQAAGQRGLVFRKH